jgi:hypothetical protein
MLRARREAWNAMAGCRGGLAAKALVDENVVAEFLGSQLCPGCVPGPALARRGWPSLWTNPVDNASATLPTAGPPCPGQRPQDDASCPAAPFGAALAQIGYRDCRAVGRCGRRWRAPARPHDRRTGAAGGSRPHRGTHVDGRGATSRRHAGPADGGGGSDTGARGGRHPGSSFTRHAGCHSDAHHVGDWPVAHTAGCHVHVHRADCNAPSGPHTSTQRVAVNHHFRRGTRADPRIRRRAASRTSRAAAGPATSHRQTHIHRAAGRHPQRHRRALWSEHGEHSGGQHDPESGQPAHRPGAGDPRLVTTPARRALTTGKEPGVPR